MQDIEYFFLEKYRYDNKKVEIYWLNLINFIYFG